MTKSEEAIKIFSDNAADFKSEFQSVLSSIIRLEAELLHQNNELAQKIDFQKREEKRLELEGVQLSKAKDALRASQIAHARKEEEVKSSESANIDEKNRLESYRKGLDDQAFSLTDREQKARETDLKNKMEERRLILFEQKLKRLAEDAEIKKQLEDMK